MVRCHVDNIPRRSSEASEAPEEENVNENFGELTSPPVVVSSDDKLVILSAAINVSVHPPLLLKLIFRLNLTPAPVAQETKLIQIQFSRHPSILCAISLNQPLLGLSIVVDL